MKVPREIPISQVCEVVRHCLGCEDLTADAGDFDLTCAIVEYFVALDKPNRTPRTRRVRTQGEAQPTLPPTAANEAPDNETTEAETEQPRRRGRPRGSKNRKSYVEATTLSGAPLPQGGESEAF